MPENKQKAGLAGLRNILPNLQPVAPTDSVPQEKSTPKPILKKKKVPRDNPAYLPKSIRLTKEAHRAITTIAMLQDIPNYEVINKLIDDYADNIDPAHRKIIKASLNLDKDY